LGKQRIVVRIAESPLSRLNVSSNDAIVVTIVVQHLDASEIFGLVRNLILRTVFFEVVFIADPRDEAEPSLWYQKQRAIVTRVYRKSGIYVHE
jgi:hypothetical protein